MKLINLVFFSVVTANAILPPVEVTEDKQLLESLEKLISNSTTTESTAKDQENALEVSAKAPSSKITTETEARSFIKYAGASYCSRTKLLNWTCANCNGYTAGTSEAVYFGSSQDETAGYVAVNKGKKLTVISFRGTTNIDNWLGNLQIGFTSARLPAPYQNARIHSGFNDMTNGLMAPVKQAVSNAIGKYPGHKIFFTGHSLGGALATVAAVKLVQAGVLTWDKVNILTYGQPRVGDPEFAAYINSKSLTVTRVTSYADLVAISPGRTFGYSHNQYNMHINKNGKTVKCSIYEEDPNCISDHLIPSREAHFTFWDQRMNTSC